MGLGGREAVQVCAQFRLVKQLTSSSSARRMASSSAANAAWRRRRGVNEWLKQAGNRGAKGRGGSQ